MNGDFEFYRGTRRRRENRASHLCDSEFKTEEGEEEKARNLFQLHRLPARENASDDSKEKERGATMRIKTLPDTTDLRVIRDDYINMRRFCISFEIEENVH